MEPHTTASNHRMAALAAVAPKQLLNMVGAVAVGKMVSTRNKHPLVVETGP